MPQLFPEVTDASTLRASFTPGLNLLVGVEGQAGVSGTAVVGQPYSIERLSTAADLFGATSPLYSLLAFLLGRGVSPVTAVASIKSASLPTLLQRQAAWGSLESLEDIRIRMTDSEVQSELIALATSCDNADLLYNKQFAVFGLPSGTTKAGALAFATTVNHRRAVFVAPGIYDASNVLLSGKYAAAAVVAAVAQNTNIADDLDTAELPNLNGIELDSIGMPVFRKRVVSGVAINDFEDLLQGGVSPLMPGRVFPVAISHLRMTYKTDGSYDALMTRLIQDQVFIDVREYIYSQNYLRRGNTAKNRAILREGVNNLLLERQDWITAITQVDGKLGYNVQVTPSTDLRKVTVSYEGIIVRGIQVVEVAGNLTIPV